MYLVLLRDTTARGPFKAGEVGEIQEWEDKTSTTMMALQANAEVLNLLKGFYKDLGEEDVFRTSDQCVQAIRAFSTQLDQFIYGIKMQLARAQHLRKTVADRKAIVSSGAKSHCGCRLNRWTSIVLAV